MKGASKLFIRRIEIPNSKGRRSSAGMRYLKVGWLRKQGMSWRGTDGGIAADSKA